MRNQAGRSWRTKLAIYILAAGSAAAAAGAALGAAGSLLSTELGAVLATLLGLVGVYLGASETVGRRLKLLQRDTETPQRWMEHGAFSWAALNGAALGVGFTTRIAFALWYVVPAASLLAGSPLVGATIYGAYGAARAGSALLVIAAANRSGLEHVMDLLLESKLTTKRTVTGPLLFAISLATVIVAGT